MEGGSCQDCGKRQQVTYRDKTDGGCYCHDCWVQFYGGPPPEYVLAAKESVKSVPRLWQVRDQPAQQDKHCRSQELPEDAPRGHIAHTVLKYKSDRNPLVSFHYNMGGQRIPFQTTIVAAGNSRHAAEVIARACYMKFEQGWGKQDVIAFRNQCYARISHGRGGIAHQQPLRQPPCTQSMLTSSEVLSSNHCVARTSRQQRSVPASSQRIVKSSYNVQPEQSQMASLVQEEPRVAAQVHTGTQQQTHTNPSLQAEKHQPQPTQMQARAHQQPQMSRLQMQPQQLYQHQHGQQLLQSPKDHAMQPCRASGSRQPGWMPANYLQLLLDNPTAPPPGKTSTASAGFCVRSQGLASQPDSLPTEDVMTRQQALGVPNPPGMRLGGVADCKAPRCLLNDGRSRRTTDCEGSPTAKDFRRDMRRADDVTTSTHDGDHACYRHPCQNLPEKRTMASAGEAHASSDSKQAASAILRQKVIDEENEVSSKTCAEQKQTEPEPESQHRECSQPTPFHHAEPQVPEEEPHSQIRFPTPQLEIPIPFPEPQMCPLPEMPCQPEDTLSTLGAPTCLEPTAQLTESQAVDLLHDVIPVPQPVHEPTTPALSQSQPTPVPIEFPSVTGDSAQADSARRESVAHTQFADTAVDASLQPVRDEACVPSVSLDFVPPLATPTQKSLPVTKAAGTTHVRAESRDSGQNCQNTPSFRPAQPHGAQHCSERQISSTGELQVTRQQQSTQKSAPSEAKTPCAGQNLVSGFAALLLQRSLAASAAAASAADSDANMITPPPGSRSSADASSNSPLSPAAAQKCMQSGELGAAAVARAISQLATMAAKLTPPGEPASALSDVRIHEQAQLVVSAALAELASAERRSAVADAKLREGAVRPKRQSEKKQLPGPGPALKKRRGIQCMEEVASNLVQADDEDPEAAHPAPNLVPESAGATFAVTG
eukprot:TRINITY_DN26266_c0_g1_i1.p1 TRINITY_DN26266_c0_g1~~TRINITY_DN26266_c0_g1_i1.p1  ORF type:complete len:938 (-),score=167.30 TRINITY_DN26266_c0_g1_i1:177-2990(-)